MTRLADISPGDTLPVREFCTNNAQLFLYNAAIWNAHRIHYDHPYATDVEGYPGLVNAGPLMGDWLEKPEDNGPRYRRLLHGLSVATHCYASQQETSAQDRRAPARSVDDIVALEEQEEERRTGRRNKKSRGDSE